MDAMTRPRQRFAGAAVALLFVSGASSARGQTQYPIFTPTTVPPTTAAPTTVPATTVPATTVPATTTTTTTLPPAKPALATTVPAVLGQTNAPVAGPAAAAVAGTGTVAFTGSNTTVPFTVAGFATIGVGILLVGASRRRRRQLVRS